MADQIGQHDVPVVFNQAIYAKAVEVICQRSEELSRVVKRMEAFHIACTLLAVIGKRFRDAGLEDIIIESEIIGIGSVNGALLGKHYNRGMRLHKIVGEAFFRLKWEAFCNWLQEKNHQTDKFQTIAARINAARINCTSKEIFVLVFEDKVDVLYDLFK